MKKTLLLFALALSSCAPAAVSSLDESSLVPSSEVVLPSIDTFAKQTIAVGTGETLAYIKAGTGERSVILLHGNQVSSLYFYPLLARVPENYTFYAVDMRGFGDSSYNSPISSMKDLSDDIDSFASALEIDDFDLIGWSLGGAVAMDYASRHAERVHALALLSSAGLYGYPLYDSEQNPYPDKEAMKANRAVSAPLAALENGDAAYFGSAWNNTFWRFVAPTAHERDLYIAESLKERCLVDVDWALMHANISDEDVGYGAEENPRYLDITMPTGMLWGSYEPVIPAAWRQTLLSLPHIALNLSFAKATHNIMISHPDDILYHFCDETDGLFSRTFTR